MKRKILSYFIILILLLINNKQVFSQEEEVSGNKVGTTSFQFLKIVPDARSTAMGEASASIVNTAEAVFHNPAGLIYVENLDVSFSYVDWLLDIKYSAFSAAYRFSYFGTFGFQLVYGDIGDIEETRVDGLGFVGKSYNPGLTGRTFSPNSLVAGLTYARGLTEKFSFGITAKYVSEKLAPGLGLEDASAAAILFDGGILYDTGFRSIKLGLSVRHFGGDIKFYAEKYPPPQTFNVSISSYLIGINGLFTNISDQKLLFAFDMIQPRDYGQQYNTGLEYSFKDMFFLRTGYKMNYDEEGFTYGFGVRLTGIRVDYSFGDFGKYLDSVHRFSLSFSM